MNVPRWILVTTFLESGKTFKYDLGQVTDVLSWVRACTEDGLSTGWAYDAHNPNNQVHP